MDTIRVKKVEAASRQLDAAIELLFAGGNVLAVHTLCGAASAIISPLIERAKPEKSWDIAAQKVCGLDAKTYYKIMRETQNFLKHADIDAHSEHEFAISDTFAIMASAVLNLAELAGTLTVPQSVFQLWHLACNLDVLAPTFEHYALIKTDFGNLSRRTMTYQLSVGRRELNAALERT